MTEAAAPVVTADVSLRKPERKQFRRAYRAERPSPEVMERQGRLTRSAWTALGDRDAVVAFLNTHDEAMGGRPIDLALASDEGLGRVEEAMTLMARATVPPSAR